MARGFGAKAKGAGAKQAEQKGNKRRGNAVAVRDVNLSESDDDEQMEQDAFVARRDKVSLNVDDDLEHEDFGDDELAVMGLGDGSEEEDSEDDDDDDDEDEDDIIEAALAKGGNSAKCEWGHAPHGHLHGWHAWQVHKPPHTASRVHCCVLLCPCSNKRCQRCAAAGNIFPA